MAKPVIKIKAFPLKYSNLASLLSSVIAAITANANFTTPNPTLAAGTALGVTLNDAITAWGPVGNRGSHADLLALREAALAVRNWLVAEANYVLNTASIAQPTDYSAQAAIITSSGFGVRNAPAPQGVLGMVQGLHQQVGIKFSPVQPRLRWKKPLGLTSPGNVKAYQIFKGTTNVFGSATQIGTTTSTAYTDASATPSTAFYYWVVGVNAAGPGLVASALLVNTPAS
jgi:hypothetical protein